MAPAAAQDSPRLALESDAAALSSNRGNDSALSAASVVPLSVRATTATPARLVDMAGDSVSTPTGAEVAGAEGYAAVPVPGADAGPTTSSPLVPGSAPRSGALSEPLPSLAPVPGQGTVAGAGVAAVRAAQLPPPLYPRASAPTGLSQASGATVGRQNSARSSSGLRSGVRGSMTGDLKIPPSIQAKMAAMALRSSSSPAVPSAVSKLPPGATPPPLVRPATSAPSSRVSSMGPMGLPTLGSGGGKANAPVGGMKKKRPGMTLSAMGGGANSDGGSSRAGSGGLGEDMISRGGGAGFMPPEEGGTPFSNFRKIVDPSGRLNFASKAVVHADGVDFSSGASFKIKMDDFELYEELGKGNYGTVQKVWHKPTKVTMALKEIRLELDDSKLKTIITELDILHRATSPYIIDFYGAFFIESCVYYCMEYMDAGSLEKVAGCDVPEQVLSRVTRCMVEGLRFLKDELKIMHRDVKPTNVLINRKGAVKLCDFGVSGQLDRSLAKTNIGCQSYMAPERIKGESQGAPTSYTASSDVWSLGLSIIEFAIGHYPYPPETYSNVFAQLTAIVHGEPPVLPDEYSETARDFVGVCLRKVAKYRPSYAMLLEHPFLKLDVGRDVDMVGWIAKALAYREANPKAIVPALA